MIVKADKLQELLENRNFSRNDFAQKLGVDLIEVDKLLNGQAVNYNTAYKFIYYFKAECAQYLIDWKKLGIKNPLEKEGADYYSILNIKEDI